MVISPDSIERTIGNWDLFNLFLEKKSNKFYCDWQEIHVDRMLIGWKHITPVFVSEASDDFSIWILEKTSVNK